MSNATLPLRCHACSLGDLLRSEHRCWGATCVQADTFQRAVRLRPAS
jgi:hypothetical protein